MSFSRRHGDPSRPWNHFAIRVRDADGEPLLSYQGNWRDIFQNWEALSRSYPGFLPSIIAKFVNASTADGFNPYRITSDGIDWEVPEPENPWSGIGYWGDHQIVYLYRLLRTQQEHEPSWLRAELARRAFAFADVPYRIASFDRLVRDPKTTIDFDPTAAAAVTERVDRLGADGRLIADAAGQRPPRDVARETPDPGPRQDVQLRPPRRDLDEHAAPRVERCQQRPRRATDCRWSPSPTFAATSSCSTTSPPM